MAKPKQADDPRLTQQSLRVLYVFLNDPIADLAGSHIFDETKLASGTLYPILMRLEEAGWLKSQWEKINPKGAGRPRRRLYRLTAVGHVRASAALAEFRGALPA
jgi:DNA-binding PadR family transcriptional regulator